MSEKLDFKVPLDGYKDPQSNKCSPMTTDDTERRRRRQTGRQKIKTAYMAAGVSKIVKFVRWRRCSSIVIMRQRTQFLVD